MIEKLNKALKLIKEVDNRLKELKVNTLLDMAIEYIELSLKDLKNLRY